MSRIKKYKYPREYLMSLYKEEERLIRYFCKENNVNVINIQHTGSLRRGRKVVGDIDFVIETDNNNLLREILSEVLDYKKTQHTQFFYKKNVKGLDYDLFIADDGYFWQMVFFLTGSEDWNLKIMAELSRQVPKKFVYTPFKILKLEDGNLKRIKIYSEEDIFNTIGLEYVEPKNRLPNNVNFKKEIN